MYVRYIPNVENFEGETMLVNIEPAAFNKIFQTVYDERLDGESKKPKDHLLEKHIAGRYLGELVRIAVDRHPQIFSEWTSADRGKFSTPYAFSSEDLSSLLGDKTEDLSFIDQFLSAQHIHSTLEQRQYFQRIGNAVVKRSVREVALTHKATLSSPFVPGYDQPEKDISIAGEGSVYVYMYHYQKLLREEIARLMPLRAPHIHFFVIDEGTVRGGAISAIPHHASHSGPFRGTSA
jgi:hexokinase